MQISGGEEDTTSPPVMGAQSPETPASTTEQFPPFLHCTNLSGEFLLQPLLPPPSLLHLVNNNLLTTLTPYDTVSFFVTLCVFTLPAIKAYKYLERSFPTFLLSGNNIKFLVKFIKMLTCINLLFPLLYNELFISNFLIYLYKKGGKNPETS